MSTTPPLGLTTTTITTTTKTPPRLTKITTTRS
jgi:hypothetical protein